MTRCQISLQSLNLAEGNSERNSSVSQQFKGFAVNCPFWMTTTHFHDMKVKPPTQHTSMAHLWYPSPKYSLAGICPCLFLWLEKGPSNYPLVSPIGFPSTFAGFVQRCAIAAIVHRFMAISTTRFLVTTSSWMMIIPTLYQYVGYLNPC